MKRRIFVFVLSILMICSIFTGCRNEEVPEAMICRDKADYAATMHFMFRIVRDGVAYMESGFSPRVFSRIWPESPYFDPFYTELVFVHSETEAVEFPDNVIVAWPSELTQGVILGIHFRVDMDESDLAERREDRNVLTLEEFGLPYPLTVADLIDNWEKVIALWNSFTPLEQQVIRAGAEDRLETGANRYRP